MHRNSVRNKNFYSKEKNQNFVQIPHFDIAKERKICFESLCNPKRECDYNLLF